METPAQVVILLVLLISWMEDPDPKDVAVKTEIQVLEYFAGVGRIAQLSEKIGYVSCGFDLDYGKQSSKRSGRRNPLDLNSSAGFILAVKLILRSKFNDLVAIFAVCCSSFVPINRATGSRDILVPEGNENIPSVRKSNKLLSRKLCQTFPMSIVFSSLIAIVFFFPPTHEPNSIWSCLRPHVR